MKKVISALVSLIILVSALVGCGDGDQSGNKVKRYTTQGKETKLIPDESATGELKVFCQMENFTEKYGNDFGDQIENATNKFRELYPNVHILVERGDGYAKYIENSEKLATEIMAGAGPDIFFVGDANFDVNKMMLSGVFADMHDYFEMDKNFNINDYNKAVFSSGQPNGKQYIIPISYNFPLMISTKKMIEKSGFDISKCADYLAFFKELDALLSKKSLRQKMDEFFDMSYAPLYMPKFSGVERVNYESRTVNIYNLRDIFKLMKKHFKEQLISGNITTVSPSYLVSGWTQNQKTIADFTAYPFEQAIEITRLLINAEETPVIFPLRNERGNITAMTASAVAVRNNSENKQNAYNFVKILINPEIQSIETYRSDHIPISNVSVDIILNHNAKSEDVFYNDKGNITLSPLSDEFIKQYKLLLNEIDEIDYFDKADIVLRENMLPYFKDEKSYDECIKNAQEALEIYVSE